MTTFKVIGCPSNKTMECFVEDAIKLRDELRIKKYENAHSFFCKYRSIFENMLNSLKAVPYERCNFFSFADQSYPLDLVKMDYENFTAFWFADIFTVHELLSLDKVNIESILENQQSRIENVKAALSWFLLKSKLTIKNPLF